ncbi:MAG: hypothetical protein R3F11_13750 [Verrucomicrobiales bacterium]
MILQRPSIGAAVLTVIAALAAACGAHGQSDPYIPKDPPPPKTLPGVSPSDMPGLPRIYAPTLPRTAASKYPWRNGITATVFWVGEEASGRNKTPNHKSSWDTEWAKNFGGTDHPEPEKRAWDFRPKDFIPNLNPFYIALPYNDCIGHAKHKPEAPRVIPWFKANFKAPGKSVCRDRWIAIRFGRRICFAQWQDCGPWVTDDWQYVFGTSAPRNNENNGAGIDVSPAVRDFLGMRSGDACDWRFVELSEVQAGPSDEIRQKQPFRDP